VPPWRRCALAAALLVLTPLSLGSAGSPELIQILKAELDRNFKILKEKAEPPPYFIAYSVTDIETHNISATLGATLGDVSARTRRLDVTVRVGSPEMDNYRLIDGRGARFTSGMAIALEDEPNAIRQAVWRETDRVYRLASQRLIKIQTDQQVKVENEEAPLDFSPAEPVSSSKPPSAVDFDVEEWSKRLQKASAEFTKYRSVIVSNLSLSVQRQTKHLVNSEGTAVTHGWTSARVSIRARAKAPDGMELAASESFEAAVPGGLPEEEALAAAVREVAENVSNQVDAPPVDPFVGPAILSRRAAGVFFHEIFGHRVEGHRLRSAADGQTFVNSLGEKVLPDFLSVIFDPTLRDMGETSLMGWYDFDDEGVPARRVPLVEAGQMKTFLMSRTPVKGIPESNGHGRRQPGREVVSRQSNLIVESARQVSGERLREMLAEEIRRQDKPFGYFFEQVTGGFTLTGRRGVQAFKVIPLVVYRVYPDGRPDELVRGADIVGTPLSAFAKIIATGDTPGVFNGYCGAESGDVPVSAVSPALLVSEIEIQRKEISQERPPILSRPYLITGGEQR
jgi:predicted Zn-dependent protease